MFFDNDYEPTIIENISFDELELKLGIFARPYPLDVLPQKWAWFAYLKAKQLGLSDLYCVSCGYYASSFIAGMGVDAGTDIYFNMRLDEAVFDIYEKVYQNCKKEGWSEEQCVIEFFNSLLLFYKSPEGAVRYEKAVFGHNIRVSSDVKAWFVQRKQSNKQTLIELLEHTLEAPKVWGAGKDKNLSFKFTYSEEEKWVQLPGENDAEKLKHLLLEGNDEQS